MRAIESRKNTRKMARTLRYEENEVKNKGARDRSENVLQKQNENLILPG